MPKNHKFLRSELASETLSQISNGDPNEKTSIKEIVDQFHENGFLLVMIFFSLPIAVPLPYPPGFTTIVGIPLMYISFQMILGYETIHLPQKISDYQINNDTLKKMADKTIPIIKTFERYLKPRFFFAQSVFAEQFVGFISLISSISIAIPLPLTNSIPAASITIMCLGLLRRDGLVLIAGFVVSIIGNIVAYASCFAVWSVAKFTIYKIMGF